MASHVWFVHLFPCKPVLGIRYLHRMVLPIAKFKVLSGSSIAGFSHFLATSWCCSCLPCFQKLIYPHKPNDSFDSAILLIFFTVPNCVRHLRRTAAWLLRRLLGQRTWSQFEVIYLLYSVVPLLCCLGWSDELSCWLYSSCLFASFCDDSQESSSPHQDCFCTLLSYLRSFKDDEQIGLRRELLV